MNTINWQTVAAIISAVAACAAVGLWVLSTRKTLRLSALVSLEQRFAQLNHAKIQDSKAWESILDTQLTETAKHLVFETFQFYHFAFHLHDQDVIRDGDYSMWRKRMETDLENFSAYRQWWRADQRKFHSAWNERFVAEIDSIVTRTQQNDSERKPAA